jgi:drug/metabolite transporter (DMT)-like permease
MKMDPVFANEVLGDESFSQDEEHGPGDERVRVVVVRTSHHLSHVAPDTPKPAHLEATVVGRPRAPTTPSASSPSTVDVTARRRARLIWAFSIIALVLGVGTLAAVGPTFKILLRDGVPPVRAAAWRAQAQLVFILPLSALELLFTPAAERSAILRRPNALAALANGLAWGIEMAIWVSLRCSTMTCDAQRARCLAPHAGTARCALEGVCHTHMWIRPSEPKPRPQVIALEYTTSARASLFSSLDPFMLMAWMSLRGQAVSKGELWGCAVAFLGLLITCADAFVGADGFFSNATHLIGDAMCILVSAIIVIEVRGSEASCTLHPSGPTPTTTPRADEHTYASCHASLSITCCQGTSRRSLKPLPCLPPPLPTPPLQVVSSRESRQHVRLFTYSAAINIIFCLTVSACSVLLEGGGWHASQPEEQLWGWIHPE